MRILRSPRALRSALQTYRKKRRRVGFVPTMGALHQGHLSLVRRSRRENDVTVVSIFVNPVQFGPKEDFKCYPRPFRRDCALLRKTKVDLIFAPAAEAMYPGGFQTTVHVGELSLGLCGRTRPVHFAGVATVVSKLLNIVGPCRLYLGQKDYQQFKVIERMVRDLDLPVKTVLCPIVREKDGLALSSRNVLLSAQERREAICLNGALEAAANSVRGGLRDTARLRSAMRKQLSRARLGRVDYAEIVDAADLRPVVKLTPRRRALLAVAVSFPHARLIDNRLVSV